LAPDAAVVAEVHLAHAALADLRAELVARDERVLLVEARAEVVGRDVRREERGGGAAALARRVGRAHVDGLGARARARGVGGAIVFRHTPLFALPKATVDSLEPFTFASSHRR